MFVYKESFRYFNITSFLYGLSVVLVCRVLNILIISWLVNLKRTEKISPTYQCVMWFSGFRGAMAFAMAIESVVLIPDTDGRKAGGKIFALTLWISITTILLKSPFIEPILEKFGLIIPKESLLDPSRRPTRNDRTESEDIYSSNWERTKRRLSGKMNNLFVKRRSSTIENNISKSDLDHTPTPGLTEISEVENQTETKKQKSKSNSSGDSIANVSIDSPDSPTSKKSLDIQVPRIIEEENEIQLNVQDKKDGDSENK